MTERSVGILVSIGYNEELQAAFNELETAQQRESREKQRAPDARLVAEHVLAEQRRQSYFNNIVLAERERDGNSWPNTPRSASWGHGC